jgi:hypothetical protein
MLPEEQRQQLRKENEESKQRQRRAAQQQDQIHVNVGSEVDEIPTAIEDSVGNEDDDDKSSVSSRQMEGSSLMKTRSTSILAAVTTKCALM